VSFPDIVSVESRYQFLLSRLLKRRELWEACEMPLHVWEFSRRTAERCFRDAGFRVVELRRRHSKRVRSRRPLALELLRLPLRSLEWPLVRSAFGTQMEFVIMKPPEAFAS
jgi:hypothetical protein